jgi:hypothetical protein
MKYTNKQKILTARGFKYLESSIIYKYVTKHESNKQIFWIGRVLGKSKSFETEREAALYVDKVLLTEGKKAVNILVPK